MARFTRLLLKCACYNQSRMNKAGKCVAAGFLAVSMLGCAKTEEPKTSTLEDGTYTGISTGFGGDVTAEVTVNYSKVANIKVTGPYETEILRDDALTKVPREILAKQSLNVDLATGATVTSKAVCDAVGQAIEQAGGDLSEWQTDATSATEVSVKKKSVQAVVVGGGAAGIATVLRLQQLGVSTALVDKSKLFGGSFLFGNQCQLVPSENAGETEDVLTKAEIAGLLRQNGVSEDMVSYFVNNVEDAVNWEIHDLGLEFDLESDWLTDTNKSAVLYSTEHGTPASILKEEISVSGTKDMPETVMYDFVRDENGKVKGILAKDSSGDLYEIDADVVVLATGGGTTAASIGPLGDQNDTSRIGILNNWQTGTGYAYTSNIGVVFEAGHAVSAGSALQAALAEGAFLVNREGRRFVREDVDEKTLTMEIGSDTAYLVMSSAAYAEYRAALNEANSKEAMKAYQAAAAKDTVLIAESLKEAAEAFELDADNLQNAVDMYNKLVEDHGKDLYGRDGDTLVSPVKGDTVYVVPVQACSTLVNNGLVVNDKLQVLDSDGNAVTNVYAVGSAVSNAFGISEIPGYSNTFAFLSGKTVGDEIAADLGK